MKIKFSHNWNNKLQQPIFTTIRRSKKEKIIYYKKNIQQTFDVVLNKKIIGKAILRDVLQHQLGNLNYELLILDTGSFTPYKIVSRFGIKELEDYCIVLIFENCLQAEKEAKKNE